MQCVFWVIKCHFQNSVDVSGACRCVTSIRIGSDRIGSGPKQLTSWLIGTSCWSSTASDPSLPDAASGRR
uniref:Uncharacterized protein n=1 Tax=Setaria italica TaxID=4555 RepID=K3YKM7_SETIT